MKRFFFRSSSSSTGKNNSLPPASADKGAFSEDEGKCGQHIRRSKKAEHSPQSLSCLDPKGRNPASRNECLEANPRLRRSQSLSSAAFLECGFGQGDQGDSPSSSGSSSHSQNRNHTSRHTRAKTVEAATFGTHDHPRSARVFLDPSQNSSKNSSNDSNEVLDLYIDGEQQQARTGQKTNPSGKENARNGGGKRPPRIQQAAPASPTGSLSSRGRQQHLSQRGWVESGFESYSSRDLAKHVVERLSQSKLRSHDLKVPVQAGFLEDGKFGLRSTNIDQNEFSLNGSENAHLSRGLSVYDENDGVHIPTSIEDDVDTELRSRLREVEEKIHTFSSEIEQENLLGDAEYNIPALVCKIRSLIEEKTGLARDLSVALQTHMDERSSIKQELRVARLDLSSWVKRLEREKSELQSTLEKELDRRSSDWSYKLEKFQEEEQRLRLRTKELAEQNVSLQRQVSTLSEKDTERGNMMVHSEEQAVELSAALAEARNKNQDLHRHLCELQERYRATKEERNCIQRNFEVKEYECKDLHLSVTKLLRTCSEQEKSIEGLRVLDETIQKRQMLDSFDRHVQKLQTEQVRLVGVEQALRRELESCKHEASCLRNENINLLNRLKGCGKEGGSLTFKLDQEFSARLRCLQIQGLSLLGQSNNLCSQLLEHIKGRNGPTFEMKDGQFIVDSDLKIQGLRRGTESMSRSLEAVSSVLHEKSILVSSEAQPHGEEDDGHDEPNEQFQDRAKNRLKAEMLLTNLLQEKLYAKDLEVEQLQAELATLARGNDTLKCEIQSALDTASSMTHQMKDLELQMLRSEEKINQLESELDECTKQLAFARGVLLKVTEERDLMWKEVKQYSERNMLLSSEVNSMKKRIEELDENILVKEGEITILKDSLGKPFDLLSSSNHKGEFELQV